MPKLDEFVRQKTKRPATPTCRRASAGQGDEVGLLFAIEHPRTARYGTTNEDAVKTAFDERATDSMDCKRAEVQGIADLLVGPRRPEETAIGFEQDACPSQFARRRLAFGDDRFQLAAFRD